MNLIQQAERLKTLPDQELLAMQQRPTVIAPYLVVAEMQRRQTMRKAATAGQDPVQQMTVAQEMSSRLAGMQPPQQQMQQQMPPAQQMRTGGVVRAQTGLAVGPDLAEVAPNPLTNFAAQMVAGQSVPGAPVPTIGNPFGMALDPGSLSGYGSPTDTAAELAKLRQVRGENPLAKIAEELGLEEQRVRGKKQGIGEILMRLGLGMAASRRPDFLGAIGEGGIGALQGFMQNRQLTQQQADELQRRRLALLERVQGSEDVLTREAADLARAQNATRNMEIQTIEANRRALANQAAQMRMAAEAAAENRRLQLDLDNAKSERERQKAIDESKNRMAELNEEYRLKGILEQQKGQGGGRGGGEVGSEAQFKGMTPLVGALNAYGSEVERLRNALRAAPPEERAGLQAQYRNALGIQRQISNEIATRFPGLIRIPFDDEPPPPAEPKEKATATKQTRIVNGEATTPEQRQAIARRFAAFDKPSEALQRVRGLEMLSEIMAAGERAKAGVSQPTVGSVPGYYPGSLVQFLQGGR